MISDELKSVLDQVARTADFTGIAVNDVTTRGLFGDTPLHTAAVWGDVNAGRILLDAGADPNAKGEHGYTPLQEAVSQGKQTFVELLLANGADPKIKNDDGETAFELANSLNHLEIKQLLTRHNKRVAH